MNFIDPNNIIYLIYMLLLLNCLDLILTILMKTMNKNLWISFFKCITHKKDYSRKRKLEEEIVPRAIKF